MNLFELMASIKLDDSAYAKGLASASGLTQSFGDKAKAALGNVAKAGAAGLAAASAAAVAFGKSSVDAGRQFDKSMSQVAATMGKTVSEIKDLRDFAQDMGAKTAFSATQAADALNFMALAGYDAEKSMNMLPNVLNLAAAGGMELANASDMITDSESALGLSTEQTTALVDQMAAASSKANASVTQMGSAILTVGGTAKVLSGGMMTLSDGTKQAYSSTTELNQVLGLLADNGVKGAEGGTALRNIILSLTAPTDKAAKTLKNLGVSALDSSGNMRSVKDIFGDLNQAVANMSEGKKTEVLSEIFNKVDLKSVNALMGTNAKRWDELAASIENSKYAAEKMAKVQLDNLEGDVTLWKSALEGAQIVVSDMLTPSLREYVQLGTSGLTAVTDAFKQANEAQNLAEGFRDAEGAIRPVNEIAKELGERFQNLSAVVPYFSFRDAADELGDVSELADGIYATLQSMSHEEQSAFSKALGVDKLDDLYEILDPVNNLQWKLTDIIEQADAAAQGDRNVLQSIFPDYEMEEILSWFDGSERGAAKLQAALETVDASKMTDGFTAAMETLPAFIENGIGLLTDALPKVIETGGLILSAVVTGIINNLPKLTDGAEQLLDTVVNGIINNLPQLTESAERLLDTLVSGIIRNLPKLADGAAQIVDALGHELGERIPALSFVFDNLSVVVSAATAALVAFKAATVISSALAALKKATEAQTIAQLALNVVMNANPFVLIATLIAAAIAALITLWHTNEGFRNAVINVWNAVRTKAVELKDGLVNAWNAVKTKTAELKNTVVGKFQEIVNFISSLPSKAYQWGYDLMENFKRAILNNPITGAISGVANTISAFLHHSTPDVGPLKNDDTWMPDMMRMFAKGINDNVPLVENAANETALSVSNGLRPVRDWANEIGQYVSVDLANGIEKEATKAQQAAEKMASNIYSGLSAWADRTIKYERLSLEEQLELWTAVQNRFAKNSEQWLNAYDKVWDIQEKLADERKKALEDEAKAAEEAEKSRYDKLASWMDKAVKYADASYAEQLRAWTSAQSMFAADSRQYAEIEEKTFDLRLSAYRDYADRVEEIAGNIADIQQSYDAEVEKRAAAVADSYKLFDAIPEKQEVSGKRLLDNLQEQIKSIRSFYANLTKLRERGVSGALADEIRAMGVGASDQLEALLKLSDKQLSRYADLYEEKQSLANSIALSELSELESETSNKIREQMTDLKALYDENAPVLGESFADGLAQGIRNGFSGVMEAAVETARGALERTREILNAGDVSFRIAELPARYNYATENPPVTTSPAAPSGGKIVLPAQDIHITAEPAPVVIDGRELARVMYQYFKDEETRHGRRLIMA